MARATARAPAAPSRNPEPESGDLARVARSLTAAAERELGVARTSIWLAIAAGDAISCDVTERRAADAAIARQRAELERRNRESEHFACTASHDLQEPLRKIQPFGERLAEDCGRALGARGTTCLGRMRDAARRIQELITARSVVPPRREGRPHRVR